MTVTGNFLSHMHTRSLLAALRSYRASRSRMEGMISEIVEARGGTFAYDDVPQEERDRSEIVPAFYLTGNWDGGEESTVTVAMLKAELARREHVPNKQESIALRKAKQARNRQKGRRNR